MTDTSRQAGDDPCVSSAHQGSTLGQLYAYALKSRPGVPALVDSRQAWSYEELGRLSARIARLLASLGLKRQETIAFLVGNRADAVACTIAAQLAGLRCVSLHAMASESDHTFMLKEVSAKALVVDNMRFANRAWALRAACAVQLVPLDDGEFGPGVVAMAADASDSEFVPGDDPDEIAQMSFTGGTTGRSKCILHKHRSRTTAVNYMMASWEWPSKIRYLATTPISHASGALILPTLLRGGTVYLRDKFDPADYFKSVAQYRINMSLLVPTQIYGLLDSPELDTADLSSLETILYGAGPISPTRLAEALRRIGPVFAQSYGQAEAPGCISYLSRADHDLEAPARLASCGRLIPGSQVRLLDKDLHEVPIGEAGEVCVRGPLVMEGYLNRPEENEKVFAGGWLHTGDIGRMDPEGYLYLIDRAKDMIVSGGFNVFPSEVENCLTLHPAVAMSAVIGVPDPKWGEAVHAIVVLREGAEVTALELSTYVKEAKGPLCTPKSIAFAQDLPKTSLDKIDRKALRSQFWGGQDRQIGGDARDSRHKTS
jgi:fatty-acyl-CoA synthase